MSVQSYTNFLKCIRTVFGDVVEVVTADDESTGHLGGDNTASEDTTTDGDITGEGALLVCTQYQ
jgi:hypothetical protein